MSKILININNLEEIKQYEKIGITNFLFAIDEYSIGYPTFSISDIPSNAYILINRVLDNLAVDGLKSIKEDLKRFKGIIYEDVAVYNIFKDTDLELIWNQVHFATNTESINFWLNKVDSAVISNELTKEEIENIISNVNKPVVLNVFGKNNIMYSRRTLLTNFNKYNNLPNNKDVVLKESISNCEFKVLENEFGTYVLNNEYFNYINKLNIDESKIKFYLIYNIDLSVDKINNIINGENFGNDGFLYKKTVYKLNDFKGVK